MLSLDTPLAESVGMAKRLHKKLKRLGPSGRPGSSGISVIEDLLFYFPFRYEDYSQFVAIEDLKPGDAVTIEATVELINGRRARRGRMYITEVVIGDETGKLKLVWFNQPYIQKSLKVGDTYLFSGKPDLYHQDLVIKQPNYEKVSAGRANTGAIIPVYPLVSGLTQKQVRASIKAVIDHAALLEDYIDDQEREAYDLIRLQDAIRGIHFPNNESDISKARRRLSFDEVFFVQLNTQLVRQFVRNAQAHPVQFLEEDVRSFVTSLPFPLTGDQKKASWEVINDMSRSQPMNRLLEGDVGAGKTLAALLPLFNTVKQGFQAAFMAPTEVLATQHFSTVYEYFKTENITCALLTGSTRMVARDGVAEAVTKKKLLDDLAVGHIDVVIGTHALIQDPVQFNRLAYVVVDEQHRFGVAQRKKLESKTGDDFVPHMLSMTATPIPRTLALTVYGDLDLSIIREMPAGRKDIQTKVVDSTKRNEAYAFIKEQIDQGRQVFVICPLIEPSDSLGAKSVKEEYKHLKAVFPDISVGLLHGKLKSKEKATVMADFNAGVTSMLVSTSVIEVGVDVPNATIMMIEGAERFGLAQLHQFRGRVGRGTHQSYCLLFPSEDAHTELARLQILENENDGFRLSEYDLELRGPGEVYGVRQSGLPEFRLADLRDIELIKKAQECARNIIDSEGPELLGRGVLRKEVKKRLENIALS